MTEEIRTDNTETLKNALNRIEELEKENTELKKRNAELKGMYAHSAREAETYKQFLELKEKENAELKTFIKDLIYENKSRCFQFSNTTCLFNSDYRSRAEELIGERL